MYNFIIKGGFLIWPILFCSIVSLTIIIERFYFFHRINIKIPNLLSRIRVLLKEGRYDEALRLAEETKGPLPHIVAVAIKIRKKDLNEKERIINRAGSKFVRILEKNLNFLAIIANITPLLGLLGTVVGMIQTFMKIQLLGGNVDVVVLSGGIWKALITTAAGLTVAIPTMVFFHYFEGKVDEQISIMKEISSDLLAVE